MNIIRSFSNLFQTPQGHDGYSFSRKEYYHNILNPKDIIDLVNKYMSLHANRHSSDIEIKFGGISFGTSLTGFLASNDAPRYIIENNYNHTINHSILFYKEKLGKHKAISQFHFVDDLFLWGMYLFNNYLQLSEIKDVEKVLAEKYKIPEALSLRDVIITDKEKNMIQLKNEVYTSIHYMTGNKLLIEKLQKEVGDYQGMIRIPSGEDQRNLFDKL